jgi:hypothetical protein
VTVSDQIQDNDGTLYGKTLNDGTITGATYGTHTGDMEQFGDYLEFDGNDDYTDTGKHFFDSGSNYAVSLWAKHNDVSNITSEAKVFSANYGRSDILFHPSGYIGMRYYTGSTYRYSHSSGIITPVSNQYYHIFAVFNETGQELYINGDLIDTYTGDANQYFTSGTTKIGMNSYSTLQNLWNGTIDEVKIWKNQTFTLEEIQEEMNSVGVANPEGIVAYYNFDEGSGTTAYDKNYISTGLNENVTSYNFDGIDDYIALDNQIYLEEFTVNVWFKTWDYPTQTRVALVGSNEGSSNWNWLGLNGRDNYLRARWSDGSENVGYVAGKNYVTDVWNKATYTYDGTNICYYINKELIICNEDVGHGIYFDYIGRGYSSVYYNGSMALVNMYDEVQNQTEITDLYNRELNDERYPFAQSPVNVSVTNAIGEEQRPYFDNVSNDVVITGNEINITLNPYTKVNASDYYSSDKINDFNVSYDSTDYVSDINGNVFLPMLSSGLVTLSKTNYFDNETTLNPYANYHASMIYWTRIYAKSILSNTTITDFTIDYKGVEYQSNGEYASIPLYATSEVIEIYNATNGTTNYIPSSYNITGSDYLQNYTFSLYDNPSVLDINMYDAQSGNLITDSVDVQVLGSSITKSDTVTDGTAYFDELAPDTYIVRFTSENYTTSEYSQTIAYNTFNSLNVYLFPNATNSVTFTTRSQVGGTAMADVIYTMSTVINNTQQVVGSRLTDIAGQVTFSYEDDKIYIFEVSKDAYESKQFQLSAPLNNDYTVWLDLVDDYEISDDYAGININYYVNSYLAPNGINILSGVFTDNRTNNFTIITGSPDGELLDYGYNLTYRGTTISDYASNSYGSSLEGQINIIDASILDKVELHYYYNSSTSGYHSFYQSFLISESAQSGLISNLRNERYGMGMLERVLVVILIAGIFGGLIGLLNGSVAGGVASIFIFGYFLYSGFLEIYFVALPILLIFMYIVRSDY